MLKRIKSDSIKSVSQSIPDAVRLFDNYPDGAFIRPHVAKILLGVSIATFWRLARSGQIKTYKLTERTTTVKVSELRAFIAAKAGNYE